MLKYTRPMGDVIHVKAETQYELCATFIRPQEFYECPFDAVHGKHSITIEDMAKAYFNEKQPFDYFSKWNGFNIPGHVYQEWRAGAKAETMSAQENRLNALITHAHLHGVNPRNFYIIGTWREDEIDHELAHALYSLEPGYKGAALDLIHSMRVVNIWAYIELTTFLKRRGYAESVYNDEIQAYLGEADLGYWKSKIGPVTGAAIYDIGTPFRKLLQEWLGKERVNV